MSKYDYRPDGNYFVRCTCTHCGESWDAPAMSGADPAGLCAACRAVTDWEKAERKSS